MRNALRVSSAESYLMLFAVWGLGLAGMPADLDESLTVTTPSTVQQPLLAVPETSRSH